MKFVCLMTTATLVLGCQMTPTVAAEPQTEAVQPVKIDTPADFVKAFLTEKAEVTDKKGKKKTEEKTVTTVTELNYEAVLSGKDFMDKAKPEFQQQLKDYFKDHKIDFDELVKAAQEMKDKLHPPVPENGTTADATAPADPTATVPADPAAAVPADQTPTENQAPAEDQEAAAESAENQVITTEAVENKVTAAAPVENKAEAPTNAQITTPVENKVETPVESSLVTAPVEEAVDAPVEQQPAAALPETYEAIIEKAAAIAPQVNTAPVAAKQTQDTTASGQFISDFVSNEQGTIYGTATSANCSQILSGLSSWNRLSQTDRDAVNQKISAVSGKTYTQLVAQAQKLKTTKTAAAVHTAAATDPGFYVGLLTGSSSLLTALFKGRRRK